MRWYGVLVGLLVVACSGEAPAESRPPPPRLPHPTLDPPAYTGEIWCAVARLSRREAVLSCATSRDACEARTTSNAPCEQRESAAARLYSYRRFDGVWSEPVVELYADLRACLRAPSRDDNRAVSECVEVRDGVFVRAQQRLLETPMRERAETTRRALWCFAYVEGGRVRCYESERECRDLWQRLGPDRGIALSECERRPEAFGYSYRHRFYDFRARSLHGTARECADDLAEQRAANRRGTGERVDLTECYLLRSSAR